MRNNKSGQGMVEYIIIVVMVALAAIAIWGVFGDRIQEMIGGAAKAIGADSTAVDAAKQPSATFIKNIK